MKAGNKTVIISPSGNFYGSEQVLFEFISSTKEKYHLYVPSNSLLYTKAIKLNKHFIYGFKSLYWLYLKISFLLLLKYKTLYVNEGGHIRYVKVLARILKNKKFILHIRLLADTDTARLKNLSKNITLVSVSEFIAKSITNYQSVVIYDPYELPDDIIQYDKINEMYRIGFIGRVTPTKGLNNIIELLKGLEAQNKPYYIDFYGRIESDKSEVLKFINICNSFEFLKVKFHGYIDNKQKIYEGINLVVHLNKEEALGRILFEAVAYNKPFIAFNKGGCGELSRLLELDDFLVQDNKYWLNNMFNSIEYFRTNKINYNEKLIKARNVIKLSFNNFRYIKELENLII